MNIIQQLLNYPNMYCYIWLRTKLKPTLPKVIWFVILKIVLESGPCTILLETLAKFQHKLKLKIQFSPDIRSTIYFDPSSSWCLSPRQRYQSYQIDIAFGVHLSDINCCGHKLYDLECDTYVGNLLDTYKFTLIHENNFYMESELEFGDGDLYQRTWFTQDYVHVGEFKFGQADGFGVRYYTDGDKYVGLFEANVPVFNMVFEEESLVYIGETKPIFGRVFGISYGDDKYIEVGYDDENDNFEGTVYFGENDIFCGSVINDTWTGFGQIFKKNGLIYSGDFVDNRFHGFGILCHLDRQGLGWRHIYTGNFECGTRHGFGVTLVYNELYVGDFKHDKRDGFGHLYDVNNNLVYRGWWVDNKFCGFGCYQDKDGSKYIGEFACGKASGSGTFYFPNGDTYVGEFKDGEREGFGVFYDSKCNLIYRGEVKGGQLCGFGEYYYSDGSKYVGEFKDNAFCGPVMDYFINGCKN